MVRSVKYHGVNQPTRQSRRLKGLGAMYEAENANVLNASLNQQQIGRDTGVNVSKQIKVEMLDLEEKNFCCIQQDSDEPCVIDITLKDLKERCRAKKRKCVKSLASQNVDVRNHQGLDHSQSGGHEHVESKEEEPDLEELIISLRQKTKKASTTDRKRQKHTHTLDDFVSQGDVLAQSPYLSSDLAQISLPVAFNDTMITDELFAAERRNLDSAKITDSAQEDVGMATNKNLPETGNSTVSLAVALKRDLQVSSHVPQLAYHIKSEIRDSCSDWHNSDDGALNCCLGVESHSDFLCQSFSERLQKLSTTGSGSTDSSFFMPQKCDDPLAETKGQKACLLSESKIKTRFHIAKPLSDTLKTEVLENDALLHNHAISNADSVEDFGRLSYSEESSTDLFNGINEDAQDNGKVTSPSTPLCCINEVSYDLRESGYDCLPRNDFGECGIKVPSMSNQEVLQFLSAEPKKDAYTPKPVSASMEPVPDNYSCTEIENHVISLEESMHDSSVNPMNNSPQSHSNERMEHILDVTDDRAQDMPICSQTKDMVINQNLLSEQVYGLEEIFLSSTERQSCYDLVVNGVDGKPDKDDKESTSNNNEDPLCSSPLSQTCFSIATESHATAEISCNTDMSNGQGKEANDLSGNCSILQNAVDMRELHSQSPGASPRCINSPSGLLSADHSLLEDADNLSSSLTEEDLATCNQPTSNITGVSTTGKRSPESQQSSIDDCSPKKLLSHRKIISPTSQEKLCRAMSDIYLNDISQVPGHRETEMMLGSGQMNKKSRSCRSGRLSPTKKLTLKTQSDSCKIPCSCTKSLSVRMHMEKAIEFSQQQMQDIEKLATQLLKGLNSMKNIVDETLSTELSSSLPSRFTADEIRATTENASELEKTTKKWLYIMTKDCTRFCKIMRSAVNDSTSPANGSFRERRKITFADEVGGLLCHVKVFDQQSSPTSTLESEQSI